MIDWNQHFDEVQVLWNYMNVVNGNLLEEDMEQADGSYLPSTHYIWLNRLPHTEYDTKMYFRQLGLELNAELLRVRDQALLGIAPSFNVSLIARSQNVLRAQERLSQVLLYDVGEVMTSRMTRSPYRDLILTNTWLSKLYVLMFDQEFMRLVKDIELTPATKFWRYPSDVTKK